MQKSKPVYRIQIRYKNGSVVDTYTNRFPSKTFWIDTADGPACFEAFLALFSGGETIKLLKTIYRQVVREGEFCL